MRRMDRTEECYINLLRIGLWSAEKCSGEKILSKVSVGMDEFLLSRQQATSGLVSRFSEREEFQNEVTLLKLQRQDHVEALRAVKARLDSAGIPFVLLKGLGCDWYYPEPGLRDMGDIDIYVGEENYGRAAHLFGPDTESQGSPKHFSIEIEGVTVEIHKRCEDLPSRRADKYFRSITVAGLTTELTPLDIDGIGVNTPSDNFNAIYLFTHFFYHFLGGGCGLRQICDWTLFLHAKRGTLDNEYIVTALKKLGLANAWKTFGAMAVRRLGLPADEMPLYDSRLSRRGDRLLRIILEMGNFGSTRKNDRRKKFGTGFFGRKLGSLLGALRQSAEMLSLFPIHSLRSLLHTIPSSTAKTLRQIFQAKRGWD